MVLTNNVIDKILALVTAAFGLVAALAWNDAIQSLFQTIFGENGGLYAKFGYAMVITIIAVVITIRLSKMK